MLVVGSDTSYGRGPGGRGGTAGGRAGGGLSDRGHEFSKRDLKKNDGPNLNTNGGPNALAKKFQGKPGDFKNQNFDPQKFQSRNGEFHENAQNKRSSFKNGAQPFTAEWYADHPAAWQYTHPHADAWAVASAAGVAAWLGWANQPVYGTSSTVVYQEVPAEESDTKR